MVTPTNSLPPFITPTLPTALPKLPPNIVPTLPTSQLPPYITPTLPDPVLIPARPQR